MGTGVLQFPTVPPNRCSHELSSRRNSSTNIASTSISSCCCFSTKNGGRTGGSQWDRNSGSSRERTKYLDEFFSYDYEDDGHRHDYGFRNTGKRRNWWSDDSLSWDEDDDDGKENIGGFGILEDAIGFSSIYKVLIGFAWMVPAVVVSMLIGNGTSGFVMALVLPLAQSALSLIFDAVMGRSSDRARHSRKRGAFAGATRGNKKMRKERKQSSQSDRKNDDYKSWEAANNFSTKKRERRTQRFGGWDELDQ